MKTFNLSEWALRHRPLVLFLVILIGVLGIVSYGKLGQSEDPPFTFKIMTVRTIWPYSAARSGRCVISTQPGRLLRVRTGRTGLGARQPAHSRWVCASMRVSLGVCVASLRPLLTASGIKQAAPAADTPLLDRVRRQAEAFRAQWRAEKFVEADNGDTEA